MRMVVYENIQKILSFDLMSKNRNWNKKMKS